MSKPMFIDSIEAAVDHVLAELPLQIVLGAPLGIGKPNPFINALYRRIKADPARSLKILTALSLEKPTGSSDLERHFLAPFVERVFGDYPDLDYVKDLRAGKLPPNIQVMEFFLKVGDYLGNEAAQQSYISTNYTFAARDLGSHGINLLTQAVAARGGPGDSLRLSLSSNSDVTAELLERLQRDPRHKVLCVGAINRELPFMLNEAEIRPDFFDVVITDPVATHSLFAAPNMKVKAQDYAIGLHAASLLPDGGTLQIGIGALGDAIAQALLLREQHNTDYRAMMKALGCDQQRRELGRFEQGIYGCSEMIGNGLLKLVQAGILRKEVFHDVTLQRLLNAGAIRTQVDIETVHTLRKAGRISSPLGAADVALLTRFGILKPEVKYDGGELVWQGQRYAADLDDAAVVARIAKELLGTSLRGGIFLHGGFFLGPRDFYQGLRSLPEETLSKIEMHRISFVNQLDGHFELGQAQRQQARFMNTIMMSTLLGAAVSDGLESGQVVSGVGGQYNFVAMAHALEGARSVLLMRATRESKDGTTSNIVWSYGHTTIPRHLRDIVVTEYGVADLRGQCDAEIIKRLLGVADSRFQQELMEAAKKHGKLEKDYELPSQQLQNLPARISGALAPFASQLPAFPFGTDFTPDELKMLAALERIKHANKNPLELIELAFCGLFQDEKVPQRYLERLGLDEVNSLKQSLLRRLFIGGL